MSESREVLRKRPVLVDSAAGNTGRSKPLQSRVEEHLASLICDGQLRAGDLVPTMKELAESLDVSTKVSFRALNELRDRGVLTQGLGRRYVVSEAAPFGLLTQSLSVPFCSCGIGHIRHGVYQRIYNALLEMGPAYGIEMVCVLEMDDSRNDGQENCDALIVSDWVWPDVRGACEGPVVGLDHWEGVDGVTHYVLTDHFRAGELVARHFWDRGARSVAYCDVSPELTDLLRAMVLRRLGFQKEWVNCGGRLEDVRVLPLVGRYAEPDYEEVVRTHAGEVDAFFGCTDHVALRILKALEQVGIPVPDRKLVAGFDGSYQALKHTPPLTTVQQPAEDIAIRALEIVSNALILGQSEPQTEHLMLPELLVGGTT